MNLMCLLESPNAPDEIKKLREQIDVKKINIISLDNPTLSTTLTDYFLDGVPNIPGDKDVVLRWNECLPMRVNWTPGVEVEPDELRQQYGFVIRVANADAPKSTASHNTRAYTMIFNNLENCNKHLKWFNSCFHTTKEIVAENKAAMNLKKQQKKQKKFTQFDTFEEVE